MPASASPYGQLGIHLASGAVDWVADPISVLLADSSYAPDIDAHVFRSDLSGTLVVPATAIGSRTRSYDAAGNATVLDGDDIVTPTFTGNPRYGVLYKDRGGAASADELIGYVDFGSPQSVVNGTLTIQWAPNGIVRMPV